MEVFFDYGEKKCEVRAHDSFKPMDLPPKVGIVERHKEKERYLRYYLACIKTLTSIYIHTYIYTLNQRILTPLVATDDRCCGDGARSAYALRGPASWVQGALWIVSTGDPEMD